MNHQRGALDTLVPEIAEPAPVNSLVQLTEIMESSAEPVGRRVDCAAVLLGFQTPAGSMSEVSAEYAALGSAYRFLKGLSSTPIPQALRVRVLALLAGCESKKARPVDPYATHEERRLMRELLSARRRQELVEAQSWPPPPDWLADINALDDTEIQRLIEDARL